MTMNTADDTCGTECPVRTITDTIPGTLIQFSSRDSGEIRVDFVSQRSEELLGISPDPATFLRNFTSGVAGNERGAFLSSLETAIHGAGKWEFTGRFTKTTGEILYFQALAEPVRSEDARVFNGIILDISDKVLGKRAVFTSNLQQSRSNPDENSGRGQTLPDKRRRIPIPGLNSQLTSYAQQSEKRQVEEALRASEVRYRRLFEAAQDGILILDADTGRIMGVNPFLIKMLGFSREQFLGKKLWEIGLFRDFVANFENFKELQQKEYIRYENLPLETADKHQIAVEFISNVYMVDDMKVIQCNVRNITDRKIAEEALRQKNDELDGYFTNTLDLLCIADTNGNFRRLNHEWESALGYSPAELEGKRFLDFVHPDDMAASICAIADLNDGKKNRQFINRYRRKDGTYLWIEWRLFSAGNRIYASARDITERKKMSEQIESSLAEKEVLLKEIHHRVKNNLQIISSLLNMQIRKTDDYKTIEALRDSQNRVLSMALVHEHLYKSKDFTYIDLMNYIYALGTGLFQSYETETKGIGFDLDIRDVHVDISTAIPLGLISNELITNSLKYAFNGRTDGRLTITATEDPQNLTFIVQDNGAGIPDGITLDTQASLGLRLVNTLTRQLKGTVAIDRSAGTKFIFTIPNRAEIRGSA